LKSSKLLLVLISLQGENGQNLYEEEKEREIKEEEENEEKKASFEFHKALLRLTDRTIDLKMLKRLT
jgi:hypothetical protein